MKKFLPLLFLGLLPFMGFSQQDDQALETLNCYEKYAAIFEKRGAGSVEDGLYEDVIVTVRKDEFADCFYGRVRVTEGKINRIQIKYQDGTYTDLVKKYKHTAPVAITNGISTPRVTVDDEIVNVLFVMKIMPKKKQFARAPEPDFDME